MKKIVLHAAIFHKSNIEWKKPASKGYVLDNFMYMHFKDK